MHPKLYSEIVSNESIFFYKTSSPSRDYHSHNYLELLYVLDGQANHTLEQQSSIISKGDYLIIDYGKVHKYHQIGNTPLRLLNCMFIPRLFDETLNNRYQLEEITKNHMFKFNFHTLKEHPANVIYHDTDNHVRNTLEKMLVEYTEKSLGYQEIMRSHLIILLVEMIRQVKDSNLTESENELVNLVSNYVQKHFSEKPLLQIIAEKYNYSVSHISRTFKQETGQTLQEYIRSIRIHESCRLLANTSNKISDIAEMVGYDDAKFFTKIFKKETATSPRDFRKKHQKKIPK